MCTRWNETQGDVTMRRISDNQHRTGIQISIGANGDRYFEYSFIYGNNLDPTIRHDVKVPLHSVIKLWNGNLSEAIIQSEGQEYPVFKKMIQEKFAHFEEDKETETTNRINNTQNN